MKPRVLVIGLAVLAAAGSSQAQPDAPEIVFSRANESASQSRWEEAVSGYAQLAGAGVAAPSLYWNWAQAASASGRKGEAVWALTRARELSPQDPSVHREVERLRGELGLDPSEMSLGFLGDARALARRFRSDGLALACFILSAFAAFGSKPRTTLSRASFLIGLCLLAPILAGAFREPRGVVIQKDAPLIDAPRGDAVALANLREGEVVPILGEEGEYLRIQDASGARGFAHTDDVRRLERDRP